MDDAVVKDARKKEQFSTAWLKLKQLAWSLIEVDQKCLVLCVIEDGNTVHDKTLIC